MSEEADKKDLTAIFETAVSQFDAAFEAQRDQRRQAVEDRRFHSIAGAQWEGQLGELFGNKIQLEVNKCHLAVVRIFNEYRNNPITVDYVSKDGTDNDDLASTCDGLYRATEQDSQAREAYDNAFDEGVGGGFGAWRLTTEYVDPFDEEDEVQKILLEPIFDADQSVYFDANAKRQDKADANHAFLIASMTKEAFEAEWPDVDVSSWQKREDVGFDWVTDDHVYVAEYFVIEDESKEISIYRDIDGNEKRHSNDDFEANPDLKKELSAIGTKFVRKRKVIERKVRKYIMTGSEVIEDVGRIAGSHIPIVPFYAKRWYVQGVEHFCGHVRHAKDMARLENMQTSTLAELSARSPVEKQILTPEQIAGHEDTWANDAVEDGAYLLINAIDDGSGNTIPTGPVGKTNAPNVPPATAALLQLTDKHLQDLLGSPQNAEEMMPNVSGKAVELVQNKLDMQAFIYMDNMSKAVQRSGQIWLSMAKDIYVEENRRERVINSTGESGFALINGKKIIDDDGETVVANDFSRAKFEVAVDVGPSSSSKRAALVRALTSMMQMTSDPQTMQILQAMAMMNMEGEGLKDIREFYRRSLVAMGVIEPTEQDKKRIAEEQATAGGDPNVDLISATADEARSAAKLNEARTAKTLAEVKETEADTAKTLAETQGGAIESEGPSGPIAAQPTTRLQIG